MKKRDFFRHLKRFFQTPKSAHKEHNYMVSEKNSVHYLDINSDTNVSTFNA